MAQSISALVVRWLVLLVSLPLQFREPIEWTNAVDSVTDTIESGGDPEILNDV